MSGAKPPGPQGIRPAASPVQDGTLALQPSPKPGPTGGMASATIANTAVQAATADDTPAKDEEIESLDLADTAKKAAYALKKEHPSVKFTSGKRTKQDQARAMSGNVVSNRKWIEETYTKSSLRDECQKWVDDNPEKKTKQEIERGLLEVFNKHADKTLGTFSKHLSGMAFDVQPVTEDADEIKMTIKGLEGLDKFLDREGGLVRWHAQFK